VKTRSYGSAPGVANLSALLSDRRQRCLKIKTFYPWNVPTCPALKRRAVVLFQPLAAGPRGPADDLPHNERRRRCLTRYRDALLEHADRSEISVRAWRFFVAEA
jgi:hypothetical protein